jgi:hypothetical protein
VLWQHTNRGRALALGIEKQGDVHGMTFHEEQSFSSLLIHPPASFDIWSSRLDSVFLHSSQVAFHNGTSPQIRSISTLVT